MNSFSGTLLNGENNWIIAAIGGAVLLLFAAGLYSKSPTSKYPLPPGPKGSPIIGNMRQVPAERSDIQFAKWSKEFSEFKSPPRGV